MYTKAGEVVEQNPKFKDSKAVLQYVYTKMRNVYGIVWEQEQKEYKEKYNVLGMPRTMEVISDKERLRSLFEGILFDMVQPSKVIALEPVHIELDPIKSVIAPLVQKRQDKTKGNNATYQAVYKNMGVCWANRLTRYCNKHGLKKSPSKILLVREDEKLFKIFQKTVNILLTN